MIKKRIDEKNDKKKVKKLEETCFFIFRKIFAPLEAKMMKQDLKKWFKKIKKRKNGKKTRGTLQFFIFWKIAIFPGFVFHVLITFFYFFIFKSFFIIFYHFSSIPPLEAKM